MADLQSGVRLSQTSPAFLHANSTSHTWPFSAFAELIDNAYDPDVAASQLFIDVEDILGTKCLVFTDNGNGMTPIKLHKMLSFGYCEKVEVNGHKPVGHYGNGFKSGSMRLGKDTLVFTKNPRTMSVGMLSQTYLRNINATTVLVPMVTWDVKTEKMLQEESAQGSLDAITKHSLFHRESELVKQFTELDVQKIGTRIIIYNLKKGDDGKLELDLESNSKDILNSETQALDFSTTLRPVMEHVPEYWRSLREYCSILFLKPRMKIILRDHKVKTKLISKSLSQTEKDVYKPVYLNSPIKIIFGFSSSKEDYGLMMYHRNRLIKAYERVGFQKQANEQGIGVVGIVEVDFLEPIHNKQDFNKTDKYNACLHALGQKLNDYWYTKTTDSQGTMAMVDERYKADWTWVQCENCLKWRRLPDGFTDEGLPDKWYCYMNADPTHNRCDVDEEPEDEDELQMRASYSKKKIKKETRKSGEMSIRERAVAEKERKLLQLQQSMKESLEPLAPSGSRSKRPTVADLQAAQKELQQARQREEEQQILIRQLQQQRKQIAQGQAQIRTVMSQGSNMSRLEAIARRPKHHAANGNVANNNSRKFMKERIRLPDGDAITITQNATSSDSENENDTASQPKRKGLIVKMPQRKRPKHITCGKKDNVIVIVSDEDSDTNENSNNPTSPVDVKPLISSIDVTIENVIKSSAGETDMEESRKETNKQTSKDTGAKTSGDTDKEESRKETTSTSKKQTVKDTGAKTKCVHRGVQTLPQDKDDKLAPTLKVTEVRAQLHSLRTNVGKLLQTILPHLQVDNLENVDAIVQGMVQVNKNGTTESKKTESIQNGDTEEIDSVEQDTKMETEDSELPVEANQPEEITTVDCSMNGQNGEQ